MKMIKFIKGIWNFLQFFVGTLMIKQRICGKYSMKKCIVFLLFYSIGIMFLLFHVKVKFLSVSAPENCTTPNAAIFEKEKHFIENVDSYVMKFSQHTATAFEKQKWTLITPGVYVYSAFFETCPSELLLSSEHCVKFIAIVDSNTTSVSNNLKCIHKIHQVISEEKSVKIEVLPENHDKLFSAAFLFCPVITSYLTHAAIYYKNNVSLSWLTVEDFNQPESSRGINLCVKPLYGELVTVELIQFLVYYSVMGVDHFIIYYDKSFKSLENLLKSLKLSNVSSEVFSWDIPLGNDLIHEYGQIAFTQDCLARSKNRFKHSIITDLDEFVVPKLHKDIKSLVSYLDKKYANAGSYVIPMVLFCKEYPVQSSRILPFYILNYNKRQKTHWMHHYRSKFIVKPERVRFSGVHFTWKLEKNFKEVFVSPDVALINHYRYCCGMVQTWFFHLFEFRVLGDTVIVDNTLLSHRDELLNNSLFKFVISLSSKNILQTFF